MNATAEQVYHAASMAEIHSVVMDMPKQYQTQVFIALQYLNCYEKNTLLPPALFLSGGGAAFILLY